MRKTLKSQIHFYTGVMFIKKSRKKNKAEISTEGIEKWFICSAIEIKRFLFIYTKALFQLLYHSSVCIYGRYLLWYVCALNWKNWNFYYAMPFSTVDDAWIHIYSLPVVSFRLSMNGWWNVENPLIYSNGKRDRGVCFIFIHKWKILRHQFYRLPSRARERNFWNLITWWKFRGFYSFYK